MKRCPACDKTFPDGMKFCQTDGTLLVEDKPIEDPYKTVVGNQSDIASAIPPVDPFKTMVASPPPKAEEDLLQLPDEPDLLKTMVVSQEELQAESKNARSDVPNLDIPPAYAPSAPLIEPKPPVQKDIAPPKIEEPSLSPPSFGDLSPPPAAFESNQNDATAIMDSDAVKESLPSSPFDSNPPDFSGQSPFGSQENKPIPSPFDGSMIGYQPPVAPPFDPPKSPPVKEAESPFGNYQEPSSSSSSPFQPPTPFGNADPFGAPAQQTDWTPPPAPVSDWQNQNLGADTPFQPPGAAVGQDKTLAIVSLVCGILSIFCCGFLTGIPAVITGFMAKGKAETDPNQYTGRGMALAGIITGIIGTILAIFWIILQIALGGFSRF